VSGAEHEATLCYLVVRAMPCLLEGAARRAPLTRARSETGGAFVGDGNSKYNACERLAAIAHQQKAIDNRKRGFGAGQRLPNLACVARGGPFYPF
jgi:hypothetical protein